MTLKELSQSLNLSISTISNVLNDGPKPASPQTRRRVLKAAREMGYIPRKNSHMAMPKRTYTIGVIPAEVGEDMLIGSFAELAMNGLFNAATKLQQDLLIFTGQDRNLPGAGVFDLLDSRVDGFIFIAPRKDSPALLRLQDSHCPYTVLCSTLGEDGLGPTFVADDADGVTQAMNHLYSLGHRKIAHLTGDLTKADARLREQTYLKWMEKHGLSVPSSYRIQGNYGRASGYTAGYEISLLNPSPTAVFCANDSMAFGLITSLNRLGVRCPEDITVVGFEDTLLAASFQPPLTTVRSPLELMTTDAVSSLVKGIDGSEIKSKVFSPILIVRGSTTRPATEKA